MFNIIGRRKWYFLFSALIIVPGTLALVLWGLRLGIDFTGGSLVEVSFALPIATQDVRDAVARQGLEASIVTTQDPSGRSSFIIRTKEVDTTQKNQLLSALSGQFGAATEDRFESVGPVIGQETARGAAFAVVGASTMILFYLWWAFRQVPKPWRYGACAVFALLHDALLVLGVWAILGRFFALEVDTLFVSAILTVVGFSVHDTIVVFDRVRENVSRFPGESFERVVNFSITQTLDRSLITGLTALFTLTALLFLGGPTIRNFVLVLLVGIVSGTYSSIFNASCLLVTWETGELGRLFGRLAGRRRVEPAAA
ncbi:MAG: protein translocase subunit SecF [Chloroflexota bacterium]